jgi:hypothetical protein
VKKRLILFLVFLVVALFIAAYLWGPSTVPAGQEALLTLSDTNFSQFQNAFDTDSDGLRLVLLLSPT